ncbi:hypothetical protein M378DRAFT_18104 [Amanita muscaria Koide BX008]|uniref:Uncharacterized protein n=1 Tax=Amanita muscaria (strain Koide BX008) TaxID=946122 RepID=A0A0C2SMQ5_AMAMK|nr:hypothetical protein M378DRAFT_18104 [Amanita muscaria Koide BX008]
MSQTCHKKRHKTWLEPAQKPWLLAWLGFPQMASVRDGSGLALAQTWLGSGSSRLEAKAVATLAMIPPLRSWEVEWYTGGMEPLFGAKRGQRKIIAEELARLNGDTAAFLQQWPMATRSVSELLRAIRRVRKPRRTTVNGTPAERDEREQGDEDPQGTAAGDAVGPSRSNQRMPRHHPY